MEGEMNATPGLRRVVLQRLREVHAEGRAITWERHGFTWYCRAELAGVPPIGVVSAKPGADFIMARGLVAQEWARLGRVDGKAKAAVQ